MEAPANRGITVTGWLALFASTGTLICCAIPIALVSLGFGTIVAYLTARYPLLVTLSEYHVWMFSTSFVLLALTAWFIWGRRYECPADPTLARGCETARLWNKRIFWIASICWFGGFTAAFLLLPLRNLIGV